MKKYLSSSVIVFLVSFLASFSVNQGFALTYPGFTPSGENTGGTFNTYFNNMYFGSGVTDLVLDYSKGCKVDEVVRGYTSTGILLCITTTTSGFTGSLVGTERYIPRYTANGTGITNSQIYDSGTIVRIGSGMSVSATRLSVLNGDISVDGVTVGQGNTPSIGNTAVGLGALYNTDLTSTSNSAFGYNSLYALVSGSNNTAIGYFAGTNLISGNNNISIGYNALIPTNGISDQLNIGNAIFGLGLNGTVAAPAGNIGIGTSAPTAKIDINGSFRLRLPSAPGMALITTDGLGNATWQAFVAGSAYATGVIIPPGSNNYLAKFDAAGSGIVASVLYESGGNIGLGMISPGARLEVAGQVKITGGAPGLGKILISDASGLASWTSYVSGSYATGIIGGAGSDNYLSKFGPGGMGIFSSQIYDDGVNVGVGTNNPNWKFEINSGIPDVSGLRFTQLNLATPIFVGGTKSLGINASGEVVAMTPLSNIAVYDGLNPATPPVPDPDSTTHRISYDFNKFLTINGKQSFVVSDGSSTANYAPYFKENGASSLCSTAASCNIADPVRNEKASPVNSFTISAQTTGYGYQLALGARGDAPLFARSGQRDPSNSGAGLFLNDGLYVTPSPWQKVLAIPANHVEYFYINTGYNSQLLPQAGGGEVGIGTSFPHSRLEVWTGASTASLMHFRGAKNVALGEYALSAPFYTGNTIAVGYSNTVALGYGAGSGLTSGTNNIFIGSNTNASSTSDNFLNIGNIIFGTGIMGTTASPQGRIGIGISNPTQQFEITQSMGIADTTGSATGVLYKGGNRFLHNYTSGLGNNNTFLGINAGNFSLTNTGNTGIGRDALLNLSSGDANTALGTSSLRANTSGSHNTAVGYNVLNINTTGSDGTAMGFGALANTTGGNNTAYGVYSLLNNTTGISNTSNGWYSLYSNTTGSNNSAFGKEALRSSVGGNGNVAFGSGAGYNLTSGSNNIALGSSTNFAVATASNQLNIGNIIFGTGLTGTVGSPAGNIGIGVTNPTYKLEVNGTGSFNAIRLTGGVNNYVLTSDASGIGTWQANPPSSTEWSITGNTGTTASHYLGTNDNMPIVFKVNKVEILKMLTDGNLSLSGMTIGRGNNYRAGNTAVGNSALSTINIGTNNTAIGSGSLKGATNGSGNTALGVNSLFSLNTGNYNTAIGYNSLGIGSQNGDNNIGIGNSALTGLNNGGNNIGIGYLAGSSITTGSGNIAIGNGTQVLSSTGSNQLNIGNIIYGFGNNVGIGVGMNNPGYTLSVSGTLQYKDGNQGVGKVLSSDANGVATWQTVAGAFVWELYGNTGTTTANYIGTNSYQPFIVKTNNIERMRVTQDGNLGIWTSTPGSYALSVGSGGSSLLNNIDVSSGSVINFIDSGVNGNGGLKWTRPNTDYASISAMQRIANQTNLEFVVGDESTGINKDKFVFMIDGLTDIYPMTLDSDYGDFYSGAMYVKRIAATGGLVGFGTKNPTAQVDIEGDIRIRGVTSPNPGDVLVATDTQGNAQWKPLNSNSGVLDSWTLLGNTGSASDYLGTNTNFPLVIKTNNITRLTVDTNGDLLLGQNSSNGIAIGRGNGQISGNTVVGVNALSSVTTGGNNTAMGSGALKSNTTGASNVSYGNRALYSNTAGNQNSAVGELSLYSNTGGNGNSANGYLSLYLNQGSYNSANGYSALYNNTTGWYNSAFGFQSMYNNTWGSYNNAIGYSALYSNTTGGYNSTVGYKASYSNTTGSNNSVFGIQALYSNVGGNGNVAFGSGAGYNLTSGDNNIALGSNTNFATTTASNQLNIGNIIFGIGLTGTVGSPAGNIGIGTSAPSQRLTVSGGTLQLINGSQGLGKFLQSDANGIASWTSIASSPTEWSNGGNSYTSTGYIGTNNANDFVIKTNSTERLRVLQDYNLSLNGITIGRGTNNRVSNLAFGDSALTGAVTGYNNTAIGYFSQKSVTGGSGNTSIGSNSLFSVTTGNNNVALGYQALYLNTASNNTAIGYFAGSGITTGSNNIAIGYNVQIPSATSSNQLNIGNWIYGSGGNIGIGVTVPTSKLSLSGSFQFTDGNQGTGVYLKGNADGTAYWYSPKSDKIIYVNRVSSPFYPISHQNHASLVTEDLPVGPYEFEFIGKFIITNPGVGVGVSLDVSSGSIVDLIGSTSIQQTSSTKFDGYFSTPSAVVKTTTSPALSTYFPGIMKGTFTVNNTGSVSIGIESSDGINSVGVMPGSILIIRSVNPLIVNLGI